MGQPARSNEVGWVESSNPACPTTDLLSGFAALKFFFLFFLLSPDSLLLSSTLPLSERCSGSGGRWRLQAMVAAAARNDSGGCGQWQWQRRWQQPPPPPFFLSPTLSFSRFPPIDLPCPSGGRPRHGGARLPFPLSLSLFPLLSLPPDPLQSSSLSPPAVEPRHSSTTSPFPLSSPLPLPLLSLSLSIPSSRSEKKGFFFELETYPYMPSLLQRKGEESTFVSSASPSFKDQNRA